MSDQMTLFGGNIRDDFETIIKINGVSFVLSLKRLTEVANSIPSIDEIEEWSWVSWKITKKGKHCYKCAGIIPFGSIIWLHSISENKQIQSHIWCKMDTVRVNFRVHKYSDPQQLLIRYGLQDYL